MLAPSLIAFSAGLILSSAWIGIKLRFFRELGDARPGLDRPDGLRKRHAAAVPRLGGIALFASFLVLVTAISLFDFFPVIDRLPVLALGVALIFALGIADDFRSLPAQVKLFGQIAIAVLCWFLGLRVELFTNPLTQETVELSPLVDFVITVFWLVALPNVINLADGMDGLAGGIGLFLCLTLGIVGVLNPYQHGLGVLNFGMAGALAGFLIFNFPPARIFLGDSGAYLIGFFIAAASLATSQKSHVGASLVVTAIALGVPLLDTLFTFVRRLLKGTPVMQGDAGHLHHRLLTVGLSAGKVLLVFYGVFLTLSLLALFTILNHGVSIWLAIGFLFLLALAALRGLGYVHSWRSLPGDLRRILNARGEVRFATLISQTLEMEIHRQSTAQDYWLMFERELGRLELDPGADPDSTIRTLSLESPIEGIVRWRIADRSPRAADFRIRKTVLAAFLAPLHLGIRKFDSPPWPGLVRARAQAPDAADPELPDPPPVTAERDSVGERGGEAPE